MTAVDYLSPVFALIVVVGLLFLSRWVFAPNVRKHKKDYGLLVQVAYAKEAAEAERAKARLNAYGLRATVGPVHQKAYVRDGHATVTPAGHAVLVFPADVDAARTVLAD